MKIDTLKDLEKTIKLCRRMGVQSIEIDGVKLQLGDAPEKANLVTEESTKTENDLSDEELLLWSAN